MAGIESIQVVARAFEDRMSDLSMIVKTIDAAVSASGDSTGPEWHQLFLSRVLELETAYEAYSDAVQVHAYPVLKDMAAITR